ncbi:uncharacterized protein LOC127730325 [Mytilus californianus]|uniref:uncharacterized protein LOC127730325 n=1 Tax=Mytilus californianus TaxID=6549 RepID=UPI002247AB0C|nr:uncharacterized protein LOC127730325 [Mytilus californianus]
MVFMEINCILMYLSIFRCIDGSPVSVILSAPQHTPEGQPFQLNCSSNIAPVGQSAEFLVNGETLTYIRRHRTMCFNTALGTECRTGMCRCSLDGRSYAIYHKLSNVKTANESFTCKMTFPNEMVIVSNAVSVSIIDFPTLIMNSSFLCKGPGSVTLVCSLEGTPAEFEFIDWKHSFNGTFVRYLKGINEGRFFFLLLNQCSYQDAGEYVCSVWYKVQKETVTVHKSTTLSILDKAVITEKSARRQGSNLVNVMYSVLFYSSSPIQSVEWFQENNTFPYPSNEFIIMQMSVYINMHGKTVEVNGLKSEMLTKNVNNFPPKKAICITNIYGKTCEEILYNEKEESSLNVFWIMLGVVIVVLVSGLITVTASLSMKRKKQTERLIYRIESSNGNAVLSENENQYIEPNAQHDVHLYEARSRPYSELVPYQTTRVYETSHGYLEIQAGMDMDTSRRSSDNYEKVE